MARPMAAALVVLGALLVGTPVVAAAQAERPDRTDPARVDRAAKKVLDARYQDVPGPRRARDPRGADDAEGRDWGGGGRVDRGGGGGELDSDGQPRRRRRGGAGGRGGGGRSGGGSDGYDLDSSAGGGGALGTIMSWLLWGAIGVAVVLIILLIVREVTRHRGDTSIDDAEPTQEDDAEAPVPEAELARPLDEADRLARDGRFAEAIHLLLLRTFQELARAAEVRIPSSLTSREVLARIPLRPGARDALAELVSVVENTWFGDDVPGEPEWLRCRHQFDRFVAIYRAGAPSLKEAA
jgi:hypothetical protein